MDLVYKLPHIKSWYDSIIIFVDKLSKLIHSEHKFKYVITLQSNHIYLDVVFVQHSLF